MMDIVLQIIMAFTGTVAFSVLFSVPKRHYLSCGLTGSVGWAVYLMISRVFHTPIVATFAASMVLSAMARFLSVKYKAPTIVFLLCGIFTLVPGAGIYYTAYYLFTGAEQEAMMKGTETFKLAVAIALGIGVSYSIPAKVYGWKQDAEVWNETEIRGNGPSPRITGRREQ